MPPKQADYDKIVKLACKPKNAPPKSKYLDSLIAATQGDEHTLNDISRSLSLRLRDSNPIVVFKALLTLHQMIRVGSAENLLGHLSRSDNLRLRNLNSQSWDVGYHPPSNLSQYARYLDTRIRAFRELKHDLVCIQTESNRRGGSSANSKGRRLRHLSVDKGLLREVKQVQRILDELTRCTFFDDDLRDENTVLAYRMVVKDLLILFQAGNEGVCNILEHFFEMSKVDAQDAFDIYKSFIKQTDKVVDYLGIARKLNNVVNVPIPNLKHAPTSLVKALEEYLNDPNFEENRLEYKRSLAVAEGRGGAGDKDKSSSSKTAAPAKSDSKDKPEDASKPAAESSSAAASAPPVAQQKIQDFLESIQPEAQPTIFGGSTSNMQLMQNQHMQAQQMMMMGQMGGPMQMQMTGAPMHNPFRQSVFPNQGAFMQPQATGFPGFGMGGGMGGGSSGFLQPQATGFIQPHTTGAPFQAQRQSTFPFAADQMPAMPTNQFGQLGQQQPMQAQQTMQAQPTGFLQPQTTGGNPFRGLGRSQSVMLGQGMSFQGNNTMNTGGSGSFGLSAPPFSPTANSDGNKSILQSGSAPALSSSPKPLTPQKTGSNNPFAPAGGVIAPVTPVAPKGPSMNELAHNRMMEQFAQQGGLTPSQFQPHQQAQQPSTPSADAGTSSWDPFAPTQSKQTNGSSAMSDIASAFAFETKPAGNNDFMSQFGSLNIGGNQQSAMNPMQQQQQQQQPPMLQRQKTGFGGSMVKPFKPTSSFGSTLVDSLPPLQESGDGMETLASTPGRQGAGTQAFPFMVPSGTGTSSTSLPDVQNGLLRGEARSISFSGQTNSSPFGQSNNSPFGQFGTGFGTANGMGASPFSAGQTMSSGGGGGMTPQKTGFQPTSSFGQTLVSQPQFSQPQQQQQQQQQSPAPLQPQTTGSNPFRMMGGVGTGTTSPGPGGAFGSTSPFAGQNSMGMGMGMGGGMGAQMPFGAQQQPQQQQQQFSLF